ncbi:triose-phosphate isomerase [Roseixanthobacter pseudopolyaromaticivorans]|uniref:triose-phosphate isomerase n=1 Tax=Xanthobacteraceae TaxID=335928 RepID=UPI003728CC55
MPAARRPLVAGNWKMNGLRHSGAELLAMVDGYDAALQARVDLLICPPATLIAGLAGEIAGAAIAIGGQDCHAKPCGAHTGDISAEMIADAGGTFVIVGHSERRTDHGESDDMVRAKAAAALRAGLVPVVCVGETQAERDADACLHVVARQVRGSLPDEAPADRLVIAYEPVWAIGSGRVPTVAEVEEVHAEIRNVLRERFGADAEKVRILYGGSVKPENAVVLLRAANVDGALVGGASLKSADFLAIASAYL